MAGDEFKSGKRKPSGLGNAAILAALIAAVALSFWYLTRSVNSNIIETNIAAMEELARHDENSIRESIVLRYDCMESLAAKLAVRNFRDFDEMFGEMPRIAQSIPSADSISFLDSRGTEYVSTRLVTENSYLRDVCEGRRSRFAVRLNTKAALQEIKREVLYIAVPVDFTVEGRRMEWMLGRIPIGELESELKISSYEGMGYSSVIDADGDYIISMTPTHSFLSRSNFFDDLDGAKFEGYSGIDEVRNTATTATTTGATSVVYTKDGQRSIMVISALDVADWYFITTVPVSVFEEQTRAIVLRFMLLLAVIAVILAAVLLMLYRQRKAREIAGEEKRRQEETERRKIIDGIASAYNVAYAVNMADDTFEKLRMDSDMIGTGEAFSNFTQAKDFFIQLLHPLDRERMRALLDYRSIRRRLAESRSFDEEYRLPINGAMIWHTMNVTAIDEDTVTIGFAMDDLGITKRHLENLRFSEYFALYEVDLDTETAKIVIDSPYYPVDRSGTAVPYRAAMTAFSESLEGEAREFFERLTDAEAVKKAFATEDKYTYTYRSGNVDRKWVDLTSFVTLRHADGTPAMFTLGFSYIDSFGAAKQELQSEIASKKAELEQALTLTNFFLEPYESAYYIDLNDLSWKVYKRTGVLERDYPAGENYLESLGRYIETEVHPDFREELSVLLKPEKLKAALSEKTQLAMDYMLTSGAKEKWYRCFAIRGAAEGCAALGFIDITNEKEEQKRREKELTDALSMAEAASRAKSDFLFNMSHDIRTPMNAITGFTAMAKKYISDISAVSGYLEKIDASGKQLLSLINNVLEMARIESGKIELDEKPVNVLQALHATTTILSEQAQINGQEFNYSIEGVRHANVFADEAKVSSVTLNILSNALKYTPEGGRIDFLFKEIPGRKPGCATYVMTVADTGIGMSSAFLSTLFDPFARERSSTVSGIQGTGLGMAIVKRIIDRMGGDIEVRSEPGRGTRFDVTLDFRINGEAAPETVKKAEDVMSVSFKGLKALLVEDNELNREIAIDILEEEGLDVEEAEDGSVAVGMLKEKGPDYYDFILMDIQMPVMNGYEATKAIRAMYPGAPLPIIAISANAFEEDRKASKAAGMDDHVAKPINVRELFSALAKFIK